MPDFIWRAAAASGKVEEGQITAVSTAAAMKQLRSQALTPLSVAEVGAMGAPGMAGAAAGNRTGAGPATRRAMVSLAVDNLIAALGEGPDAGRPPSPVNPDALATASTNNTIIAKRQGA